MTQLTRRLFSAMNTAPKTVDSTVNSGPVTGSIKLPRLFATGAFTLLSLATLQPPAAAQSLNNGQACYSIADNNPPAQGNGGGTDFADSLIRIDDFAARAVTVVADPVTQAGGGSVNGIEALTSRPDFGELIAANENEIGVVDPDTGVFTSLGFIEGFQDFDAIVIDRTSDQQTRLIGVSKRRGADKENAIIEIFIQLDENGQSVGLSAPNELSRIGADQFPGDTDSIDGIAIDPNNNGLVYGVANSGPRSDQRFVRIDLNGGTLQDLGPFLATDGTEIDDIEDLSFDLVDNILFATSGSNRSALTEFAFIYSNPAGGVLGNALDQFNLETASGGEIDFEASACLRRDVVEAGNLLLVKRITAITPVGGSEQRFNAFDNQSQDSFDDELQAATEGAFPPGVVDLGPTQPLAPGDLVEYTVYVYNNTGGPISNIELCDPLRRPNVLRPDTISFASPTAPPSDANDLNFAQLQNADRSPQAPLDASCSAVNLDGNSNFLAGPPGPIGPEGTGGGVVTNQFNLAPGEIAAVRFEVEVGAPQGEETVDDFDLGS